MAETDVDVLLGNLKQLMDGQKYSKFSDEECAQILSLYEELTCLRAFLKDWDTNRAEHEEIEDVVKQIRDVTYEAEGIVDLSAVQGVGLSPNFKKWRYLLYKISWRDLLSNILKEIQSINQKASQIYQKKLPSGIVVAPQGGMSSHQSSSRAGAPNVEDETVVGFEDEVEAMKERLTGETKQRQVISIIGMAGSGKTTLARKLYNDPLIGYHFYVRGWTYVSQVYRKRDLLLDLLSSVGQHKDDIHSTIDENLGAELYRRLKGNRYLIVMDDIWKIGAWNDLKIYFPDDYNGSRILFTSRHTDVALHANPASHPLSLPFLDEEESWDLFQQKVFPKENCPLELMEIGKQIVRKCGGLPLAIVVVAGILAKTDNKLKLWNQVSERLSSYIVGSPEQQCMETLALSYNSLPLHLKTCFLYFGGFPEDREISVRKLIWLWIAEGFIHQVGQKSLEAIAEDYLMDLVDRSLVMAAKRRSTGEIRACRMHDLLHDFCLRKAEEENFLLQIYRYDEEIQLSFTANEEFFSLFDSRFLVPGGIHMGYDQVCSSSSTFSSGMAPVDKKKPRRLFIHSQIPCNTSYSEPSFPLIRSFLCFNPKQDASAEFNRFCYTMLHLRVLDLSVISISMFPIETLEELVFLRYLALQINISFGMLRGISLLSSLEVLLIVSKRREITVIPPSVWNTGNLRHLCIGGENMIFAETGPSILNNLRTLSQVQPSRGCQNVLARTPNLRKLVFCGRFNLAKDSDFWIPELDFLNHLQTLKLLNRHVPDGHRFNLQGVKFPPNLRRLTLSNTAFDWKEMSVIGKLPNLEALKLEFQACVGPLWKTSDECFPRLKFLRFYYINIEQWSTCSSHFPCLQHIVLHRCRKLKDIPYELGDIPTLHTIEVNGCSEFAVNYARRIKEQQQSIGNDWLKILIKLPDKEFPAYY